MIKRTVELIPATMSEVIRYAIHTAFLLLQCLRSASVRLVLRNDELKRQEDLDFTLVSEFAETVLGRLTFNENEPTTGDILQVRLSGRISEELDHLLRAGFAPNKSAAIRRALELHYQIALKTHNGFQFGTLSEIGDFTFLPILDLVYSENRNQDGFASCSSKAGERNVSWHFDVQNEATSRDLFVFENIIDDMLDPSGRYEILSQSTMNILSRHYIVKDHRLGCLCEAKVANMLPELNYSDRMQLFHAEIEAALSCSEAGYFCHVIDAGRTKSADFEFPFMVMDRWGKTLEDEINAPASPKNLRRAVQIVKGISAALSVLHQKGIVHGDLNPSRILITSKGDAKLIDLGLCLSSITRPENVRVVIQAIASNPSIQESRFIAPEFGSRDAVIDTRSDIYSLGALFRYILEKWELRAGELKKVEPLSGLSLINRIVEMALRRFPEERYQTIKDFEYALRDAESQIYLCTDFHSLEETSEIPTRVLFDAYEKWLRLGGIQTPCLDLSQFSKNLSDEFVSTWESVWANANNMHEPFRSAHIACTIAQLHYLMTETHDDLGILRNVGFNISPELKSSFFELREQIARIVAEMEVRKILEPGDDAPEIISEFTDQC
jgi:serine/threonine protein kinase